MSEHATTYVPKSAFAKWFESRLPIAGLIHSSFIAFPVPRNKTDQAIKLTGAAVQTVPAGAQVLGYPIYSLDEVGDYLLNYDDSDQVGTVSLQKVKDYAGTDITIPPHSDSKYFVMVAVKVVGPVTQPLRGCTFDYTLGSHKYRQSFPCEFQLGESP